MHVGCAYYPYRGGSTVRLDNLISNEPNIRSHLITHVMDVDQNEADRSAIEVHRIASYFTVAGWRLLRRLARSLKPKAVVLHNPWVILFWCFFVDPLHRIRRVAEIHNFRDEANWKRAITGFLYRWMDAVVVLSFKAVPYVVETYGLASERVFAIRNGAPPSRRMRRVESNARTVFSYIGTMHEWQGVLIAARAIQSLDDSFFVNSTVVFAGGGPADSKLRSLLMKHISDGRVEHHGWVDQHHADKLLDMSDVVLVPRTSTLGTELILPLKVFEAMRQGKAILATEVGGLTEVLTHNENAWIVGPGCPAELAAGMRTLLEDAGLRQRLGRQSQMDVDRLESWSESGAIYQRVLVPGISS